MPLIFHQWLIDNIRLCILDGIEDWNTIGRLLVADPEVAKRLWEKYGDNTTYRQKLDRFDREAAKRPVFGTPEYDAQFTKNGGGG